MQTVYRNYKELKEKDERLALELLSDKGVGNWQNEEIYIYHDIESFAEYELVAGWYFDMRLDRDFNGAPNPLKFINLKELGKALVDSWDCSGHFKTANNEIVQTYYGW